MSLGQYHVIMSFTNVLTKFLGNKLKQCLTGLISKNQTAFIQGRSISENFLLAQEIVQNYHKDKGKARCTNKVDLMRAYGSVEWGSLYNALLL